jgi:hypothetical protein
VWVLREKYPRVLTANRALRGRDGFENRLGINNLNDALSHIGPPVTEAPDLDRETHKLTGAPSAHEIDKLRIKHKHLLKDSREASAPVLGHLEARHRPSNRDM